jgi:glutamine cyclotransferase
MARDLPANRFGEGLVLLEGKLYQLTWKSGVGYVYDAETLALVPGKDGVSAVTVAR